jgi:hypothetical protein
MIEATGAGFQLRYGDLAIPFSIETGPRQRLSITVFPDLRLRVLAPEDADTAAILERVDRRAKWIAKQWRFFEESAPPTPPRLYVSGETHLYLGRQYRLKVRDLESPQESEGVKLAGRFFWISTRDRSDKTRTKKLLESWYEAHAKALFANRLKKCLQNAHGLELDGAPLLVVRRMSKRWGSCTANGKVLLNLELVKMPLACIDYVIFHELCHLKAPHHGKEFYQLLKRNLPDWENRKKRLEEFGR